MNEHVSIETGMALQQAGWKWEPKEGDRCLPHECQCPVLVANVRTVQQGILVTCRLSYQRERDYWPGAGLETCLHLPLLGELLDWLAERGLDPILSWSGDFWRLDCLKRPLEDGEDDLFPDLMGHHDDKVEAAAMAVLAILRQEEST